MVETCMQDNRVNWQELVQKGVLRPLDLAFAEFIQSLNPQFDQQASEQLGLVAGFISKALGEQHACLPVAAIGQPYGALATLPNSEALVALLTQTQGVAVVDSAQPLHEPPKQPLMLEFSPQGPQLYLQRYWQYETRLAWHLTQRAAQSRHLDMAKASALLEQLFPASPEENQQDLDWQKIAVCVAAIKPLAIITGGPGTGKTTTVTRLMALLQGLRLQQQPDAPLKIQLVAPTGKAAARLSESILQAKSRLPESLQIALPETCSTVHRLLGPRPNSPYFIHDVHNPLHLDLLILDEASMVDLPLMTKLFDALPEHAQVVMLGDKDQLASVEAGSVLSDICAAALPVVNQGQSPQTLPSYSAELVTALSQLTGQDLSSLSNNGQTAKVSDNLVMLQKSHRFSADSGIGHLARAMNYGDIRGTRNLLQNPQWQDVVWHQQASPQQLVNHLIPHYQDYFQAVKAGQGTQAFALLAQQQVLCAQRKGDFGIEQLNRLIELELSRRNLIDISRDFYPGRPIMLTQNDHQLRLFNGDIGIVMADPEQPELLKIWFIDATGQLRSVLPGRLPPHETLYAMTIHKSQGSEFANVYLCLPLVSHKSQAKGLTRELLYTGLTRAKQNFSLYANDLALQLCLQQQVQRGSGLAGRLI